MKSRRTKIHLEAKDWLALGRKESYEGSCYLQDPVLSLFSSLDPDHWAPSPYLAQVPSSPSCPCVSLHQAPQVSTDWISALQTGIFSNKFQVWNMEQAKTKYHHLSPKINWGPSTLCWFLPNTHSPGTAFPGTQGNNVRSQPAAWRQCNGNKSRGSCGKKAIVPKNLNDVTLLPNSVSKACFPTASASLQLPVGRVEGTEQINLLCRGCMIIIMHHFSAQSPFPPEHRAEQHRGVGLGPLKGPHPTWGCVGSSNGRSVPVPRGRRAARAPRYCTPTYKPLPFALWHLLEILIMGCGPQWSSPEQM